MQKILLLSSFFLLLLFSSAHAEDMSIYDTEISVDATATSASLAREQAMSGANRQAVMTVAERLTTPAGAAVLKPLNNNQILNFIKEVTIEDEKVSDVRYMAKLKITINGDILKAYLSEKNTPVTMMNESKVIVIPTFREFNTDAPQLWETTNVWRMAWENTPQNSGPVKIISLDDSFADKITAAQALQMNGIILDQIADDEQTKDIYIADASYDGIDGLNVTLYAYNNGSQETLRIPGVRDNQLMANAVEKVKESLLLKQQSQSVLPTSSSVNVLYAFKTLKQWINTWKQLKNTAGVTEVNIDALSLGKVQFRILFDGTEETLLYNLRNKNMNLKPFGTFYNLEHF